MNDSDISTYINSLRTFEFGFADGKEAGIKLRLIDEVYTTGQVGKSCGISQTTVRKLIDSGEIKCYRVPGSRHQRVSNENLIDFMIKNRISFHELKKYLFSKYQETL